MKDSKKEIHDVENEILIAQKRLSLADLKENIHILNSEAENLKEELEQQKEDLALFKENAHKEKEIFVLKLKDETTKEKVIFKQQVAQFQNQIESGQNKINSLEDQIFKLKEQERDALQKVSIETEKKVYLITSNKEHEKRFKLNEERALIERQKLKELKRETLQNKMYIKKSALECSELNKETKSLSKRLKSLYTNRNKLKRRSHKIMLSNEALSNKTNSLEKDYCKLKGLVSSTNNELMTLKTLLFEEQGKCESKRKELGIIEFQIGSQNETLSKNVDTLKNHQASISKLEEELQVLEKSQIKSNKQKNIIEAELESLGESFILKQSSLDSLKQAIELLKRERSELNYYTQTIKEELIEFEANRTKVSSELAILKDGFEKLEAEKFSLELEITKLKQSSQEYVAENEMIQKQNAQLMIQNNDKSNESIELQDTIETYQKKLKFIKHSRDRLLKKVSFLENKKIKEQRILYKTSMRKKKYEVEEENFNLLREEHNKLEDDYKNLEDKVRSAHFNHDALRSEIVEKRSQALAKLDCINTEVRVAQGRYSKLQEKLLDKEKFYVDKTAQLEKEFEQLRKENEKKISARNIVVNNEIEKSKKEEEQKLRAQLELIRKDARIENDMRKNKILNDAEVVAEKILQDARLKAISQIKESKKSKEDVLCDVQKYLLQKFDFEFDKSDFNSEDESKTKYFFSSSRRTNQFWWSISTAFTFFITFSVIQFVFPDLTQRAKQKISLMIFDHGESSRAIASIMKEKKAKTEFRATKDLRYKESIVDNTIYTTNYSKTWLSESFQEKLMVDLSDYFSYKLHIDDNLAIESLNKYISFIERTNNHLKKMTVSNSTNEIEALKRDEQVFNDFLSSHLGGIDKRAAFKKYLKTYYLNHLNSQM